MRKFCGIWLRAIFFTALAVSFWVPNVPLAQAATEKPVVQMVSLVKVEKEAVKKAEPAAVPPKPAIPPATEVEIQRRFNELKSELLDDRADSIEWWLAVVAIVLTFFGIVVAIGGFFGIWIFRDIVADARESANEAKEIVAEARKSAEATDQVAIDARKSTEDAKELVEEIKGYRDEVKDIRDETAETAADEPERVRQVAEDTRKNPQASPMDIAIANAISLQQEGKLEDAIDKWRGIANVMEGIDDNLASGAWVSVGYLLGQQGKNEEVIDACDKAIGLKPDFAKAYNNLGVAKKGLGQYEAAIVDYDEAIRLDSNYALAYGNRGVAYLELGNKEAARRDFEKALELAHNAGDDKVAKNAEQELKKLNEK